MFTRHKILLLDDDHELVELYREMLCRLPSQPEIFTATSGARAIALLDSQPFSLLISDLNMPKMDGLQVLTIVRRKFPQLRTAVMTSVVDAQFRTRAYAMGIDLFLEKPNTGREINFFIDCIESLLDREPDRGGFRGVQSKSLVDIIQLECLSQSSSVLKVTNGSLTGKVWFKNGDLIDAATQDLTGETAFRKILSWNTGKNFAKGGLARQVLRCGVDQIAVFEPDFAGQRAVGDFEHRGTLRQAFQLDDVHQTFTLHAAEPAGVGLAVQQRFNAVDEEVDFPAGVRLFQKQVDAHGVGARAELRVHDRSHDRRAELRKFAPHDGQHLEPVHLRHVKVRDQERKGLGIQQGNGPGAGGGRENLRLTGQPAEHLAVQLHQFVIVVEQ